MRYSAVYHQWAGIHMSASLCRTEFGRTLICQAPTPATSDEEDKSNEDGHFSLMANLARAEAGLCKIDGGAPSLVCRTLHAVIGRDLMKSVLTWLDDTC